MAEGAKVGLVLSGGGAKGAYQVGVLKALVGLGTRVDVVAGASIGALNGAVLVSAPSLETGVERLENLWLQLAGSSPLAVNIPGYVSLLLSLGLRMPGAAGFGVVLKLIHRAAQRNGVQLPKVLRVLDAGVLSDEPLQRLLDEYLDATTLSSSRPFYVSIYKSVGGLGDMLQVLAAELGVTDTTDSEFLHFQSLSGPEQLEVLLASAAIPVLFAPRQLNNSLYSDGGQGGWRKQQGNTPIAPLLKAGCNTVIVSHLNDGSLWSRHDFPDATILEVRPQSSLARGAGPLGGFKDVLGFDGQKIRSWIDQGYEDAMRCLGSLMSATEVRNNLRHSMQVLDASEQSDSAADLRLEDAIAKLV